MSYLSIFWFLVIKSLW